MMFGTRLALITPAIAAGFGVWSSVALAEPELLSEAFTIAHEEATPHAPHDAEMLSPGHGHEHGQLEIPDGAAVPTVELVIHPDALQGWNIELQTTNFAFAPERVNTSTTAMEGHAHLFINGEKITRLYGNWYYLNPLPPGTYEVSVVLNANTHEEFVHNGQVIQDVEILQVP